MNLREEFNGFVLTMAFVTPIVFAVTEATARSYKPTPRADAYIKTHNVQNPEAAFLMRCEEHKERRGERFWREDCPKSFAKVPPLSADRWILKEGSVAIQPPVYGPPMLEPLESETPVLQPQNTLPHCQKEPFRLRFRGVDCLRAAPDPSAP